MLITQSRLTPEQAALVDAVDGESLRTVTQTTAYLHPDEAAAFLEDPAGFEHLVRILMKQCGRPNTPVTHAVFCYLLTGVLYSRSRNFPAVQLSPA